METKSAANRYGYCLERWGFSAQRPIKKSYKQDSEAVAQWVGETYPSIRKYAKAQNKVILILDNLRIHHAKKVSLWLEKHKEEIEVFYLPSYSPEYNPDEFLNSDLKRNIGNRSMPHSAEDIVSNVRSYIKSLQSMPEKVMSFFNAPSVCYAVA